MALFIQDPIFPDAPSLHESLLEACQGAIKGGGAFAFVTKKGGELFLKDSIFKDLATDGSFDLIVGIDEVTNTRALNTLRKISEELPGLTVRAFYHDLKGMIFHPKFCWFRHEAGGKLIIGSGNLTARGLRGNWEAFTVSSLSPEEIDELENIWNTWIDFHIDSLKSPDDEQVLKRAAENIFKFSPKGPKPTGEVEEGDEVDDDNFEPAQNTASILIAEIPGASDRWSQANFDKKNFQDFFGMKIGDKKLRAVLQHVDENGKLGQLEVRQGVSVKSKNYRLELSAGSGLAYPDSAPPIGVFVCMAARTFRYRLLMPGDQGYSIISKFLVDNWKGRKDRKRRIVTDVETLKQLWPKSPLWVEPLDGTQP